MLLSGSAESVRTASLSGTNLLVDPSMGPDAQHLSQLSNILLRQAAGITLRNCTSGGLSKAVSLMQRH